MTERERLIELIDKALDKHTSTIENYAHPIQEWIADYLLANGVIVPPCKAGDMVYRICERVDGRNNGYIRRVEVTPNNLDFIDCMIKDGTYYLTKEEAEQALKERQTNGKVY